MTDNTQPLALMLADRLHHEQPTVLRIDAEHAGEELRRQHARIAELEAQLSSSGFTAADMATASAQGFRAGAASVAASAGSEPVAPYSIDADTLGIRSTVAEAITGALAFGAQGVNQPPEGHWLAPFWKAAREDKEAVRVKRDLRNELQQQCSTWGTYWRGSDAHGVVLSHPQAVELLQNALGVEVEIEIRGRQTYDDTGVIGDVPCPDCTHPSPPEGMVGGWNGGSND